MYKEYMLNFQWNLDGEIINETFYFESEKTMISFVEQSENIKVESAFKLEKLNNNIFTKRKEDAYETDAACG